MRLDQPHHRLLGNHRIHLGQRALPPRDLALVLVGRRGKAHLLHKCRTATVTCTQYRSLTHGLCRASLGVRDDQKDYVAANALSIAQEYSTHQRYFVLLSIGMRSLSALFNGATLKRPGVAFLWRFMVDRRYQLRGYGSAALALALQEMKSRGFKMVETSTVLGPSSPLKFYLSQGFHEANQGAPGGEWLLRRIL